jgi:hypothetical protein
MSAKRSTLSNAERTLIDIAVRLDSAVRYWEEHKGEVSEAWLGQGIEEELVCILFSYMAQSTY